MFFFVLLLNILFFENLICCQALEDGNVLLRLAHLYEVLFLLFPITICHSSSGFFLLVHGI